MNAAGLLKELHMESDLFIEERRTLLLIIPLEARVLVKFIIISIFMRVVFISQFDLEQLGRSIYVDAVVEVTEVECE